MNLKILYAVTAFSNVTALLFVFCAFDYSGDTWRLRWSNYVQFQLQSTSQPSPWRYLKGAQSQTVNSASSNVPLVLPRAVNFQQIHSLSHLFNLLEPI